MIHESGDYWDMDDYGSLQWLRGANVENGNDRDVGNIIRKVLHKAGNRTIYTPDFFSLKKFKSIPVIIFDEVKLSGAAHDLIQGCKYYGLGHTEEDDKFALVFAENGHKAAIEKTPEALDNFELNNSDFRGIEGDIYGITLQQLCNLDKFYQNGVKYDRKMFNFIHRNFSNGQTYEFEAWMYVAVQNHWRKVPHLRIGNHCKVHYLTGTYYYK
jgi:hypothetical protein